MPLVAISGSVAADVSFSSHSQEWAGTVSAVHPVVQLGPPGRSVAHQPKSTPDLCGEDGTLANPADLVHHAVIRVVAVLDAVPASGC